MKTQQICHKCYSYNSPISLETKDELKGLGTVKWEVHSTNLHGERKVQPSCICRPETVDHNSLYQALM